MKKQKTKVKAVKTIRAWAVWMPYPWNLVAAEVHRKPFRIGRYRIYWTKAEAWRDVKENYKGWNTKPEYITVNGKREKLTRLNAGTTVIPVLIKPLKP